MTAEYSSFLRLQQAAELLMTLTEDDEPLPEIFALFTQFIVLCKAGSETVLPAFQLCLLHLLGLLPSTSDDTRFMNLSLESQQYIEACTQIHDLGKLAQMFPGSDELRRFITIVLTAQLQRPLKSMGMVI